MNTPWAWLETKSMTRRRNTEAAGHQANVRTHCVDDNTTSTPPCSRDLMPRTPRHRTHATKSDSKILPKETTFGKQLFLKFDMKLKTTHVSCGRQQHPPQCAHFKELRVPLNVKYVVLADKCNTSMVLCE